MKTILITGAGGFIGSHLVETCVQKGFKVKAFIHYNSNAHKGWLQDSSLKNDIEFCFGDVRDFDSVYNALKGCEEVFHLAALIGIPYSYVSPLAYVKTNIEGTYNVLQASRDLSVKNILLTSTSEIFGTAQYVPIDEKHPVNAQSPYAATKVAADQLGLSFHRAFHLPVKIVRPFNTYGPRQSMRAIIPTVITQVLNGQKDIKLGNTMPTRDFTYVQDTVAGFLEIARCPELVGEITNIGMNEEISIQELVKKIAALVGRKINIISEDGRLRPSKSEVERLMCDHTKIIKATQWKPKYDLDKGLSETIQWFEKNLKILEVEAYHI